MAAGANRLRGVLDAGGIADGAGSLILTGSGSSFYACECAAGPLQESLGVTASALPAGLILTHPRGSLPPSGKFLLVSLARSGDSPESGAVVERLLHEERATQLLITCNRDGALAVRFRSRPRIESDRAAAGDERPEPGDDQQLHQSRSGGALARRTGRAISRERGEALRRGPHSSRGARRRPRDPCAPPILRASSIWVAATGWVPLTNRRSRCWNPTAAACPRWPNPSSGCATVPWPRSARTASSSRFSHPTRSSARTSGTSWRSSSARIWAGGSWSSANAFLRTSPGNPRTSGST